MEHRRVAGKSALVTGATRGIGRQIALTLAREGASIGVNHLSSREETKRANQLTDEIKRLGQQGIALEGDVSDAATVRRVLDTFVKAFGHIDILVTNAGVIHRELLIDVTEEVWDRIIAVNLKGTFNALHAAIPHFVRRGRGKIVTIASELALVGRAGLAAYAASKAGVIALTKSAARELAPFGVNVNAVAPGPIDTEMLRINPEFRDENRFNVPLGRWGTPEDVALTVLFLSSDDSNYYTGQVLSPNGGVVM